MNVNSKYEELLNEYKNKYGENSQAALLIKLEYLKTLILTHQNKNKINTLILDIKKQYRSMDKSSSQNSFHPTHIDEKGIINFSHEYFNDHYNDLKGIWDSNIHEVNITNISKFKNSNWYIYTLDESYNLIIFDKPFNPREILIGRKNTDIPHPILVSKRNLKAVCAGEISFLNLNNGKMHIILNNKSGHFLPNENALMKTKHVLSELFNLKLEEITEFNCSF